MISIYLLNDMLQVVRSQLLSIPAPLPYTPPLQKDSVCGIGNRAEGLLDLGRFRLE